MNISIRSFARGLCALSIVLAALPFSTSQAAPINYGDFTGSSVMYLDVTETANTPGDTAPLYSSPAITGNVLDFNPKGFVASASGGSTDVTDGQLNFMLRSLTGIAITDIKLSEGGDYSLFGSGTAATSLFYALTISSVTVLEIDGATLASPVVLPGANASGSDDLGGGNELGSLWSLDLNYDINAALTNAGVSFQAGATSLDIVLDNTLGAISETSSIAMIAKKDFRVEVSTIPIPASIWLFGSGMLGLVGIARRKIAASRYT